MSVLSAKRTYLKAGDRRAQILDVAKRVFVKRGYHAANVAHICDAAKIGRGTLYQYFENKRDVMVALLEDIATRVARVLEERPKMAPIVGAFGKTKPPRKVIVAFVSRRMRDMLDAVFVDESTLRLILRDARGLDGAVDKLIARIDALVIAAMEEDLAAAQRAGLLRAGNRKMIARYLLGGVEKVILSSLAEDDEPLDLDALVAMAVEIELFGLLVEEVRR